MTSQIVGPGRLLAERYFVEDLLDEVIGVRSWRAVDQVLSRPVLLQTMPAEDPRAEAFTAAARAAAMVGDSRFVRVLDAAIDAETAAYVVREWVTGRDLSMLLSAGPLNPDQASALAREVAEALATAHRDGLTHLRLQPASVLVTADGGVKIAGLAIEAALYGDTTDNPGRVDAAGVGQILYAALTARWPGQSVPGLAEAPWVDGRIASPRQVRPGVPRGLDEIVDQALGQDRRHHPRLLRNPAEVAAVLAAQASGPRVNGLIGGYADDPAHPEPPPAVLYETSAPMIPAGEPEQPDQLGPMSRPVARALGVLAGALLLIGATLVGLQLLLSGFGDDPEATTTPPAASTATPDSPSPETPTADPELTPLDLVAAVDFDPEGNGEESPQTVDNAIDGDPGTAWRTVTYYSPLEGQKPGVGLYVDLGEPLAVQLVQLQLVGDNSAVEVLVAPADASDVPEGIDDWTRVGQSDPAGTEVEFTFDEEVTTQYVLVWFTRLPPDGGDFRGGIAEVEVLG